MGLIHTSRLEFREFFDERIPKYAILSHRWEDIEISYQEFENSEEKDGPGFAKIAAFCALAKRRNLDWAWIDTCCIDKRSSAELSEAVNSMWRWYHNSEECYVYLSDVEWAGPESVGALKRSVWFTRGWTLQELLATGRLQFFDHHWTYIGEKQNLWKEISARTGISREHLLNPLLVHEASVAQRMSWASDRETSRAEDITYSLMGIFDVNMPLIYGEGGEKAFYRLQSEIIKQSDDESIFAWDNLGSYYPCGPLAPSPQFFQNSGDIEVDPLATLSLKRPPYSMTNRGLAIKVPYYEPKKGWKEVKHLEVPLGCCRIDSKDGKVITILLKYSQGYWYRNLGGSLALGISKEIKDGHATIYVRT